MQQQFSSHTCHGTVVTINESRVGMKVAGPQGQVSPQQLVKIGRHSSKDSGQLCQLELVSVKAVSPQ